MRPDRQPAAGGPGAIRAALDELVSGLSPAEAGERPAEALSALVEWASAVALLIDAGALGPDRSWTAACSAAKSAASRGPLERCPLLERWAERPPGWAGGGRAERAIGLLAAAKPGGERRASLAGAVLEVAAGLSLSVEQGGARLSPGQGRRAKGVCFTPPDLARAVLASALEPLWTEGEGRLRAASLGVLDPAAGSGVFLCEAAALIAERLGPPLFPRGITHSLSGPLLFGVEIDATSAQVAEALAALSAGRPGAARVVVGDALSGLDFAQLASLSLDRRAGGEPAIERLLADGSRGAISLAELAADAVVAASMAGLSARASRALRQRALSACEGRGDERGLRLEVDQMLAGNRPVHFALSFPEARGGFDLVAGNPPFGNAIEQATGRSAAEARHFRRAFGPIARGAYDRAQLFAARAVSLLAPGGVHALVLPRASLSQRAALALQRHVEEQAPLFALLAPSSARLFSGASVYVACPIGRRPADGAAPPPIAVVRGDPASPEGPASPDRTPPAPRSASHGQAGEPWWSLVEAGRGPRVLPDGISSVPLGDLAVAHAGCSAQAAYDLRPLVVDQVEGEGARLITAGLIDRHRLLWGERPARFLGRSLAHPRFPDLQRLPPSVRRALERQAGPKVLVAGLSRRLEAAAELEGGAAGVVGTLVLHPRAGAPGPLELAALVSSWAMSRAYLSRWGAKRMGEGSWTIGRRELLETPVPSAIASPELGARVRSLLDERGAPLDDDADAALQRLYAAAFGLEGEDGFAALATWYTERGAF